MDSVLSQWVNCHGKTLLPPKSSPIAMLLKPINEELECLQASAIRARHEQMAMLIVMENRQYKCELDALKKAILNLNNQ